MIWLEYLLPLIFLAPLGATALVVLGLRYLMQRRLRSPLTGRLLHESGQSLRDRLHHAQTMLFLNAALGPIAAMTPLVYGMGRMLLANRQNWLEWAFYGLLSTIAVLVFCGLLIGTVARIRRLQFGLACDMAVAQEINRLIHPEAHPYFVFHDVPGDGFSVDHVAITPHGVFSVTTKARSRPLNVPPDKAVIVDGERLRFPHQEESQLLRHTRGTSRWLSHYLERQCGGPVPVCGVLVLPGWEVEIEKMPEGLLVISGEALASAIDHHRFATLDTATRTEVLRAIVQRIEI